ncbi:hypothetical protein Q4575_05345 [Psychrosphaera sp. 1_MG-2023]|uniref:hypothetical protein n=1 Tax=Psychrosphaera sp. 1_MG-2023 TaxID=3062643 RepID=UPI0026E16F7A|nr:hypothetical protein [Psychrosphaera sp. 1_MG-2023]MDO6718815.1 hypothetical protein [Psychrosphaera sp. 1_MG-2023]
MEMPDGTIFKISDGGETPTFIEVKGFDDVDGEVGSKGQLVKAGTLSDTEEKYGASSFKDGGERNFKFRAEADDAGQIELKSVCESQEERDCQIILPNGKQWDITVQFAGWTYGQPSKNTPMQIIALGGVNKDNGINTTT